MQVHVWRLRGATRQQRRVVQQLFKDLSSVAGVRIRIGRAKQSIEFGNNLFALGEEALHAWWLPNRIAIRPYLVGAQLYAVTAHEIGHAFGFEHRAKGLMSTVVLKSMRPGRRFPTLRQRRRIVAQFATLLCKHLLTHMH